MTEDQQRFEEIINNIDELVEEAINIIPENMVTKAKSYWYAQMLCAINDDHEFLGGSMHHMQDCLDEWIEQEEDYGDESDHRPRTWMSQEDEDDYIANNPRQRSYCLECGEDFTVFMHNCSNTSSYEEKYGCSRCDDQCGHCNV